MNMNFLCERLKQSTKQQSDPKYVFVGLKTQVLFVLTLCNCLTLEHAPSAFSQLSQRTRQQFEFLPIIALVLFVFRVNPTRHFRQLGQASSSATG